VGQPVGRRARNPWWWPWGAAIALFTTLRALGIRDWDGLIYVFIVTVAFMAGRFEGARRG